jgi:hypothetical protein
MSLHAVCLSVSSYRDALTIQRLSPGEFMVDRLNIVLVDWNLHTLLLQINVRVACYD